MGGENTFAVALLAALAASFTAAAMTASSPSLSFIVVVLVGSLLVPSSSKVLKDT
jgi:hypothetical protein